MVGNGKKSQKELVVGMLQEGYKPSQIWKLLGYDRSYVYRICKNLDPDYFVLKQGQTCGQSVDKKQNVHAQRVRFFVHRMGEKYKSHSNTFFKNFVPDVDITCQGGVIYAIARKKFDGDTQEKALTNSISFWKVVASRLESRLGVVIFGRGKAAFEFLYGEWETRDSVVAVDAEERGHRWRVYHGDDGKLRLSVDWSDGTPNHETHHRRDAHVDNIVFGNHVNDILDNPDLPASSEIWKILASVVTNQNNTSGSLMAITAYLKSQLPKDSDPGISSFSEADYFG